MKNKLYVSTIIVVEYEENKTISEITNDLKKIADNWVCRKWFKNF